MINDKYNVENHGENNGLIIGKNSGNVYLTITKVKKIPSLISNLVMLLGNACLEDEYSTSSIDIKDFKPDEKIEYNCVVVYKEIIKEFSTYYSICDNFLNAFDDSNVNGKSKILRCVHVWYLLAKGQVLKEKPGKSEIEVIRANSDKIIDMVKERILQVVRDSKETDTTYQEDLELGIVCFICYCFMECKILEKPL